MPKPRPEILDSPRLTTMLKIVSATHVTLFRLSAGKLGRLPQGLRNLRGYPTCLLTTIGRKTGKARTRPLFYLGDGDRVVLVASRAGSPKEPAWYHNLIANPNVLIQTGARRRPMRARRADEEERAELWPRLVETYPPYEDYESWTDRTLPVVICEPA